MERERGGERGREKERAREREDGMGGDGTYVELCCHYSLAGQCL